MSLARRSLALAAALALGLAFHADAKASATSAASDIWITSKAKMALLTAEDVSATAVRVDTVDGKVTLHGTVASADEKMRAEKAVRSVSGVADVRNLLQVVSKPAQEQAAVADQELQSRVKDKLAKDPALSDSDIQVQSVNNGTVLLAGSAKTLSDHMRALEDARSVPGVRRVASEIKSPEALADDEIWRDGKADPKTYETSSARDMLITSEAKVRLIANSETPARDINVDTMGGAVTLFGSVPTAQAKTAAEAEVKKVDGVKSVENHLQVVPPSVASATAQKDDQIQNAIQERIGKREGMGDVAVAVENGVARLTGSVKNQSDRLTAITVARTTEGVKSVVADLAVKPS